MKNGTGSISLRAVQGLVDYIAGVGKAAAVLPMGKKKQFVAQLYK